MMNDHEIKAKIAQLSAGMMQAATYAQAYGARGSFKKMASELAIVERRVASLRKYISSRPLPVDDVLATIAAVHGDDDAEMIAVEQADKAKRRGAR